MISYKRYESTSSFFHKGYRVYYSSSRYQKKNIIKSFEYLLSDNSSPEKVFKNNPRSYCALHTLDDQLVVLKIPRGRNRRKWERFLTLFRESEGLRTFKNLKLLEDLGLNAPIPLLAAERRHYGFVTDSLVCYKFEKGTTAGTDDADSVVAALMALHRKNYIRTDPQLANFLISDRGVVFIDFRLKKTIFMPSIRKHLELARLVRTCPQARESIKQAIDTNSFTFKTAKMVETSLYWQKKLKRALQRYVSKRP